MEDDFEFISLAALTANVLRWVEFGVQAHAVHAPQDEEEVQPEPNGDARQDG